MINQIEEETGSLPSNLPRGVAPEIAAENPDVQAIIAPRLTMLMEIANSFLLTIIESMDSVPYGIRWICKQIRSLTRVRKPISVVCLVWLILRISAKISRSNWLCHLLTHWWLFLPSIYQPSHCHPTSIYAGGRRSCQASPSNSHSGMCFPIFPNGNTYSIQARLRKCYKTLPTSLRMQRRHIWWPLIPSLRITRPASINFLTVYVRLGIFMTPWRCVLRCLCFEEQW